MLKGSNALTGAAFLKVCSESSTTLPQTAEMDVLWLTIRSVQQDQLQQTG